MFPRESLPKDSYCDEQRDEERGDSSADDSDELDRVESLLSCDLDRDVRLDVDLGVDVYDVRHVVRAVDLRFDKSERVLGRVEGSEERDRLGKNRGKSDGLLLHVRK